MLDSSVVIGCTRPDDVHHDRTVAQIRDARLRGDSFVLPATVLSESLVAAHRIGSVQAAQRHEELIAFFGAARVVDAAVADRAAALRAKRPALRLPDALVIATGIVDDAVVLTCDQRLAGIDPRVQVVGG